MPPKGWKNGQPPPGYKFADKTKETKYKTPSKSSSSKKKKATPSSSKTSSPTKTSYSISDKAAALKKLDKYLSKKGNSLDEVTLPYALNEVGLLYIGDRNMRGWMAEREFIFAAVDCGLGDKTVIRQGDRDLVEEYMDSGVLPESSDEEEESEDEEEEDFFNEEEDNNDDEVEAYDDDEVDITDITEDEVDRILSNWPVALFIPNLLGYLRIVLSFIGLNYALQSQPNIALNIWIVAALLDCIDGMAARILNQCSEFGVLLDVIADNTLRTTIWISAIIEAMKSGNDMSSIGICVWVSIICLEWLTMFCTQSKEDDTHWKDMEGDDTPFFVKLIFTNNFRGAGTFAIYGLFVAPIGSYVLYVADQTWLVNVFAEDYLANLVLVAYVGRFTTIMVELWICKKFMKDVIAEEPVIVGGVPIILGAPEKED